MFVNCLDIIFNEEWYRTYPDKQTNQQIMNKLRWVLDVRINVKGDWVLMQKAGRSIYISSTVWFHEARGAGGFLQACGILLQKMMEHQRAPSQISFYFISFHLYHFALYPAPASPPPLLLTLPDPPPLPFPSSFKKWFSIRLCRIEKGKPHL